MAIDDMRWYSTVLGMYGYSTVPLQWMVPWTFSPQDQGPRKKHGRKISAYPSPYSYPA